MLSFSEQFHENVFNYLPITFSLKVATNPRYFRLSLLKELEPFLAFHSALEAGKERAAEFHKSINTNQQASTQELAGTQDQGRRRRRNNAQQKGQKLKGASAPHKKAVEHNRHSMPLCHFVGHNIWLLKPTNLNRGRGVHLFQTLEELNKLIVNCMQRDAERKSLSFVIQKYIEEPLLINERKFDIRMWMLVTQELDFYLFKEGYLRTSSKKYIVDSNDIDNRFVHLTNNAIQVHGEDYGKFEDGNQMSFAAFQKYLNTHHPEKAISVEAEILPKIKNIVRKSVLAVKKKLNSENRKYCFEIFGYDFILDADFNVWLIEVNTNPCLEESSPLLTALLNRMLDNAFKLTVDVMFPPSPQYMQLPKKVYPLEGYANDVNLW